jgi:hypothetical protein
MSIGEWTGGLPLEADQMLAEPPVPPFDWIREGTSLWAFEENGAFAIPRIGVEAEPWSWDQRRFAANFAFPDGRVLQDMGVGPMPKVLDPAGRPMVLGGGPMTFRCLDPFLHWTVSFDGEVVDTTVAAQIAGAIDRTRRTRLRYDLDLTMVVPANVQDVSPASFARWGKGKQRDAVSVGLGWRFEQCLRGTGELELDGHKRAFNLVGSRVKRRSVRTDGLMLRGHCWQTAVFPDGRAFGLEARPVHPDGFEPWNEAFVYQDGKMHFGKALDPKWLGELIAKGEDVSVALETDLGITRIKGTTAISTFRAAGKELWGLNLQQGAARYQWDGQATYGMIERSMPTTLTAKMD